MFKHNKKLLRDVKVEKPNPQYAVLMQEQLGGCNGEVKAAMQYMSQSFRAQDPGIKDLLLDIGAEELSHMEMVAQTINLLNGHEVDYTQVKAGELETMVTFGLNPALVNSSGNPWTADYVTVTGDLAADLLADIASEQRAKVVYEYLYRQIDDKYVNADLSDLPLPFKAYTTIENRTAIATQAYSWCQEFARLYPSEMNVYYEDTNFVCYCFRQEPYAPYELGLSRERR